MEFGKFSGREKFGVALTAGSLVVTLAACGARPHTVVNPGGPMVTASSPGTSEIPSTSPNPNDACTTVQVEVDPGGRFNRANASDIQKQINALAVAYGDQPVTADNVLNALSLVTNASIDPEYAKALAYEQQRLAAGEAPLTAEELLDHGFPPDPCLTEEQIGQVNNLFSALVPKLGAKIGSQTSADIRGLYHSLVDNYDNFKQNFLPTVQSSP